MPRADGGKEHPSSPGLNVAAREKQKPLNLRVEVSRLAQNGGSPNGSAVATAVAPVSAAGAEQRSIEPPTPATTAATTTSAINNSTSPSCHQRTRRTRSIRSDWVCDMNGKSPESTAGSQRKCLRNSRNPQRNQATSDLPSSAGIA